VTAATPPIFKYVAIAACFLLGMPRAPRLQVKFAVNTASARFSSLDDLLAEHGKDFYHIFRHPEWLARIGMRLK